MAIALASASFRPQPSLAARQRQAAPCPARPLLAGLAAAPLAPVCRRSLQQRRQTQQAAAAASGSSGDAAAAGSAPASGGRHAFLHDFCMCIPYGALLLAAGLVAKLFGWGQPAVVMSVVGAVQVGLSNLSLKAWRANKSAAPVTLAEAVLAAWTANYAYRAVQAGVSTMIMGTLLGLSAAMALFLLYNVAAGGNPPRRGTHAAVAAEPAPSAAA